MAGRRTEDGPVGRRGPVGPVGVGGGVSCGPALVVLTTQIGEPLAEGVEGTPDEETADRCPANQQRVHHTQRTGPPWSERVSASRPPPWRRISRRPGQL